MPKLLYLLRTSNCSANPFLADFDKIPRTGLYTILNVDLNEDQWLQASLPVADGGLGIRGAQMLASSASLASATSTLILQGSILPSNTKSVPDQSVASTEIVWETISSSPISASNKQHIEKAWDKFMATQHASFLQSRAQCDVDKARLLAISSSHSGDWLHASPIASIASIGLRLSDEAVRLALAQRLGCKTYEPHTCICERPVDTWELHVLSCRKSSPRQQRHSSMNDIMWRAVKRAQIPATKEPANLILQNGKRPDSSTLNPWSRGKPMAWDVNVPDTLRNHTLATLPQRQGSCEPGSSQQNRQI